jgi:hypothetical protein
MPSQCHFLSFGFFGSVIVGRKGACTVIRINKEGTPPPPLFFRLYFEISPSTQNRHNTSVAEPHHFFAAPDPGKNCDAAPAAPAPAMAPAPTLLYWKAKFLKKLRLNDAAPAQQHCIILNISPKHSN